MPSRKRKAAVLEGDAPSSADTGYDDPNSSWTLKSPKPPKFNFEKLVIGGEGYNKKYSKDDLLRLVELASTENLGKFPLEWAENTPKAIFRARGHKEAVEYAVQTTMKDGSRTYPRMIIYTDGSTKTTRNSPKVEFSGFGLTYKRFDLVVGGIEQNYWTDAAYGVRGITDIQAVEILAIHRSLWTALFEMARRSARSPGPRDDRKPPPRVIVLSDCFGAVNYMYVCYNYNKFGDRKHPHMTLRPKDLPTGFFNEASQPIDRLLNLDVSVEVNWIPGHVGIEGNERADKLASLGADYVSKLPPDPCHERALIPIQLSHPNKEQKVFDQIHMGHAVTDLLYWQKDTTRALMEHLLEIQSRQPFRAMHEVLDLILKESPVRSQQENSKKRKMNEEPDNSNTIDLPRTKKLKLNTGNSTETEYVTRPKDPPLRGLLCWK